MKKVKTVKIQRREFKGNVVVSLSPNEVRVWVCNDKGVNIFRIKAVGEVHSADFGDTPILPSHLKQVDVIVVPPRVRASVDQEGGLHPE